MYLMTAEQAKNFMKAYKDDFVKGQLKFINYKSPPFIFTRLFILNISSFIDKINKKLLNPNKKACPV